MAQPTTMTTITTICPNCKVRLPPNTTSCPECGEDLAPLIRLQLAPYILYNDGLRLAWSNDLDGAVQKLQQAVALAPDDPAPYIVLGKLYAQQGNAAQARRAWEQVKLRWPDEQNAQAEVEKGLALLAARDAAALADTQKKRQGERRQRWASRVLFFVLGGVCVGGSVLSVNLLQQQANQLPGTSIVAALPSETATIASIIARAQTATQPADAGSTATEVPTVTMPASPTAQPALPTAAETATEPPLNAAPAAASVTPSPMASPTVIPTVSPTATPTVTPSQVPTSTPPPTATQTPTVDPARRAAAWTATASALDLIGRVSRTITANPAFIGLTIKIQEQNGTIVLEGDVPNTVVYFQLKAVAASVPGVTQVNVERVRVVYIVKAGDTLTEISVTMYGQPGLWTLIVQANHLTNPNLIKPGTALIIPPRA